MRLIKRGLVDINTENDMSRVSKSDDRRGALIWLNNGIYSNQ